MVSPKEMTAKKKKKWNKNNWPKRGGNRPRGKKKGQIMFGPGCPRFLGGGGLFSRQGRGGWSWNPSPPVEPKGHQTDKKKKTRETGPKKGNTENKKFPTNPWRMTAPFHPTGEEKDSKLTRILGFLVPKPIKVTGTFWRIPPRGRGKPLGPWTCKGKKFRGDIPHECTVFGGSPKPPKNPKNRNLERGGRIKQTPLNQITKKSPWTAQKKRGPRPPHYGAPPTLRG